jgi:hypothetical protein
MTNCEVSLLEPHDPAVLTDMVKIHYLYSSSFEEFPATCNHLPTRPSFSVTNKQTVNISLHLREPNVTIFSSTTPTTTQVSDAAPLIGRLVAGLTFRRPGFNPRLSHCRICGVQSGTGTGSPAITAAVCCQCHSVSVLCSFIHLFRSYINVATDRVIMRDI